MLVLGGGFFCLAVLGLMATSDNRRNGNTLIDGPVDAQAGGPGGRQVAGDTLSEDVLSVRKSASTWRRKDSKSGLVPFHQINTRAFRGPVSSMLIRGDNKDWGQVHIWVNVAGNRAREITLAPNWYLQHLGCPMRVNARVKGAAFKMNKTSPDALLYAQKISVDGVTCKLRNNGGFALWSDQLK